MSSKAAFLDRDDTLIDDPGYLNDPEQVKLLDGVAEALIELRKLGYKLIVVSNQSAIARGIVTEKVLGKIHERLNQLLAEKSVRLDKIYYCPYHPDGVIAKYRKESNDRKPNPGMLLRAADEMDIDLEQSWMLGNKDSDVGAGQRAGCKTILIDDGTHIRKFDIEQTSPNYRAVNIKEAVNIIKKDIRVSAATVNDKQADHNVQAPQEPEQQPVEEPRPQINQRPQPQTIREPEPANNKAEQTVNETEQLTGRALRQTPPEKISGSKTERLLESILEQLKNMQRNDMFDEFSIMRLLAGLIQTVAVFCVVAGVLLFINSAGEKEPVFIALGFGGVLQVMALTFYIMRGRR